MKKFNPKVSIVIPVYNGSNYLKEAIDSAIAQTYRNIEIIVINDGSTDKRATEKIAKSYGSKIKYYKKENGGVATALNLGIKKMTGEYFSWLSHDDMYYPEKVEKQIEYLATLKNKKIVLYADYELINEYSQHISFVIHDHQMLIIKPEYSLLRGCVNGITILVPKDAFVGSGLFRTDLKCTQDYDMWNRIQKKFPFTHMEGTISKTRIHAKQDSNNHPKVITEGNSLWIELMDSISASAKKRLEGSEYTYYQNMYYHLNRSAYVEATNHARIRAQLIYGKLDNRVKNIEPLVSVIIPCFNQGKYVDDAVSSILMQTYKNVEIIIIDDGSTDVQTQDILSNYQKPKTNIYKTKNQGVTLARAYGVALAKGDYIQLLDADDYLSNQKIEQQMRVFKADQDAGVCYSNYRYYYEESKQWADPHQSITLSNKPMEDFVYRWQRSLSIPIHTAIFKKEVFLKSLSLVPGIKGAEDWIMWVDISSHGTKFVYLNEDLVTYRVQDRSISKDYGHMFYWSCRAVSYIAEKYINKNEINKYNEAQKKYLVYLSDILLYVGMINQIDSLSDSIKKLTDENIRIYKSKSWRITKYPRAIRRAMYLFSTYGPTLYIKRLILKSCKKIISILE